MINKVVKHMIDQLHSAYCLLQTANRALHTATCLLILAFTITSATAQNFPVQIIPQAIPPAPIHFSDYADANTVSSPLRVQIILNDLEIANREVRLKAHFQGNGITFQSNDIVVGADPLFLEGGVPLILTNVELAPYFQFQNITGISPNVYGQTIPEGAYQFCFEVYDVLSGNRLSNKSCATTVVFQNEPPFLVMPRDKTNIEEINPQNIVFQWTPRSINVTNVEYELSLVEIWDTQIDPQAAFLSSPPVFQVTTTATTYVYGPADPLLLSGKNYAWRVQARAKQGIEEIGLFKNEGYSEIFSFSYAGSCDLPLSLNHEVKGSTNANIFWDDFTTDIPEYTVRYRKKGDDNEWFLSKTTTNQLTLWDLKAGTTYEYQIQKKCTVTGSDWSLAKEFTTALEFEEESVIDCGIAPDINLTNTDPLPSISTGTSFKAGDFPVKITEVSGSNGRFTGKGYVSLPYLKNIKVAVEFTNILINTDQEMAEGSVNTVYDPTWKNMLSVDELLDVAEDITDEFTGGDENVEYSITFEIPSEESITIEDGKIVVKGPNGETKTFDHDDGDSYEITDANGNTFIIDKDGNVTTGEKGAEGGASNAQSTDGISGGSGTAADPSVSNITATDITVHFETSKNTKYGLDKVDTGSDYEKANYPKAITANGSDYYPVHKAVVEGQTDEFLAIVENNNPEIDLDSLQFKTVKGTQIKNTRNGNTFTLTINGSNSYHNDEAVVTYKGKDGKYKIIASFFIHHIKQHEVIDVVMVAVNGSSQIPDLEKQLNEIYGKAGATFKVTTKVLALDQNDWDDNDNKILDYDGSGLMSDYPQELKNIQQKYKNDNKEWNRSAYHLFILPTDIPLGKSLSGFMPKTRQWGYVFGAHTVDALEDKSSQSLVAAHELGHGVFALPHPFQNDENKSGSGTDWLMDYGGGDQLSYTNWAAMSDESLQLFIFQDEEDGEIANKIWYTPNWEPFTVENTSTITSIKIDNVPLGTIPGFKLNGKLYHAEFESGKFLGYFSNYNKQDATHDEYLPSKISSLDSDASVYLFQYNGGCGYNRYYETKFYYANANKVTISYGSDTNVKFVGTIPCTQSGTENKNPFKASLCELTNEVNAVNSFGAENAIKKLIEAYTKRKTITDTTSPRTKGEFYHLVNVSPSDLDGRAEFIEDKLYLLKQKTGINFFVIFQPVDTKMSLKARDDFAKEVLNKSNIPAGEKTVVITVPYFTLTPLASFSAINCIQPGFAQNNNSVVRSQSFGFKQNDNLLEYVLGAFADIEKPLFVRRYFLKANGTLVNQELETESGKLLRGYPYINEVEFYESPSLDAIRNYQYIISITAPDDPEYDVPAFLEIRNDWIEKLNDLFLKAEQDEIKSFKENNLSFWGTKKDIEIGGFREFFVRDIALTNTYVSTKINGTYLESWKILFARSNLEPKHLYDFDVWSVVDQTVYGGLDIISLIPVADTFADLGGVLYAGFRGDLENTVIYSGSLLVPFAGAGYLKGIKNGVEYADESYAIVAKKVNGQVEFDVKKVSSVKPEELQVSTILTNDEEIAKKIAKEDLENYIDKDGVGKLLNDLGGSISLFNRLTSNLASSLDNTIFNVLSTELDNQSFIRFDNNEFLIQSPKSFLNETGDNLYDMVFDGKYYVKYDLSDGRILMGDVQDGTYYAFAQNKTPLVIQSGQNAEQVIQAHLLAQTNKLKSIIGLSSNRVVKVLGLDIIPSTTKTSTFIGRLEGGNYNINQLKALIGDFQNLDLGEIPGGLNILNRPETYFQDFLPWLINHNIPWMKRVVDRGDDVYVASEVWKTDIITTVRNGKLSPTITAYELKYLQIKQIKPKNLNEIQWKEVQEILSNLEFDESVLKIF